MADVNVVLLSGGKGTRLWPVSNNSQPKQFIILPNIGYSSFQIAVLNSLKITLIDNIIISTNINYKNFIKNQLSDLGLLFKDSQIILENSINNTGKAIYDACVKLKQENNDKITYFLPTDHGEYEDKDFLADSLLIIDPKRITIFGQKTLEICNRFGYIKTGKKISDNYYQVVKFVEKPKKMYFTEVEYSNLGVYLAKPSVFYNEFHKLHHNLIGQFSLSLSVDKIISEKSKILNVIEVDFSWCDLGSIESLYKYCGDAEFHCCEVDVLEINKFNCINKKFKLSYKNKILKIMKI